jgi:hypothetical protein
MGLLHPRRYKGILWTPNDACKYETCGNTYATFEGSGGEGECADNAVIAAIAGGAAAAVIFIIAAVVIVMKCRQKPRTANAPVRPAVQASPFAVQATATAMPVASATAIPVTAQPAAGETIMMGQPMAPAVQMATFTPPQASAGAPNFCSGCGTKNPNPNAKFCSSCGKNFIEA